LICLVPIVLAEGLVTEYWRLIAMRALQGVGSAMVFAPALALAGDLTEKGQTGSQLSLVTMAFGLGISFGSFLSGHAVRFGDVAHFATGLLLAAIGILIVTTKAPKDVKTE